MCKTTTLSNHSPTTGYQDYFQATYYKTLRTTLKSACFLDCRVHGYHTLRYHTLLPRDEGLPATSRVGPRLLLMAHPTGAISADGGRALVMVLVCLSLT